jgi:TP901 family phage tail tape measure protein
MNNFIGVSSSGIARQERWFKKLTPAVSETQKQLLGMASAAAVATAVIGGATFSAKSIMEYEKAVASFRTIVGGTDKEFAPFQQMINQVAKDTKKSSIDTAEAFEKIAGLNADFAKTPQAIGSVTKAVITLSKASGDELGPSAESLIGIMNQFNFAADQADRTINVLAAGANVGASSIVQTSEAFVNFGSVAKGANITLEQSVGLVQTLGKFSVFGAEAGTKLRGSVLKLQQAGVGYKSGQFQINDALEEARAKIDKLKTAKEKDAAILKMFGAENIATGKILLSNIETFKKFTDSVTGTSEAQKAAATRSDTLEEKLNELKAAWINMLTGSDKAAAGMVKVKKALAFVTDNLDTIVSVGLDVIVVFTAWKALIIGSKVALTAWNIAAGLAASRSGTLLFAIQGNSAAMRSYTAATTASTIAQRALNFAMSMNPFVATALAVGTLVASVYALVKGLDEVEKRVQKEKQNSFNNEITRVNELSKKYQEQGLSREQAVARAAMAEKKLFEKRLADNNLLIEQEKAKGVFGADKDKIMELASKNSDIQARLAALSNSAKTADMANQLEYTQTGNKELFNPKWMDNKAKAEITVNTPPGSVTEVKGDKKQVSVIPSTGGSTMHR